MKRAVYALAAALVIAVVVFAASGLRASATSQLNVVPSPESLRFRLVGDEPISGPDGQSIVTGWKVLVFKDLRSGQCYVTFTHAGSAAVADAINCADKPAGR